MNKLGSKLAASVRQAKEQNEQKQQTEAKPVQSSGVDTKPPAAQVIIPSRRVWPD